MLPAESRLRRRIDFSVTVRSGRRASRGSLVVHLMATDRPEQQLTTRSGTQSPRAGFVVSKAVGNAVTRNKVKRRLRALVRSRLAQLPDAASLVVRALPTAASRTYAQLGQDLDQALTAVRAVRTRAAGTDQAGGPSSGGGRARRRRGGGD